MVDSDKVVYYCSQYTVHPSQLFYQTVDGGLTPFASTIPAKAAMQLKKGLVSCRETEEYLESYGNAYARSLRSADEAEGNLVNFKKMIDAYPTQKFPPVKVSINHRGRLVLTDGVHRSASALANDLPVSVEVIYRSEEWLNLKQTLYQIANGTALYQPVNHPDLMGWKSWRQDTPHRAMLISREVKRYARLTPNSPVSSISVRGLDFACHTGGITNPLCRDGFEMVGIDSNSNAIYAAKIISQMDEIGSGKKHPEFQVGTDFTGEYNFIVCLSFLNHHWVDGRAALGARIFKKMTDSTKMVFFDCPAPGDPVGGVLPYCESAWALKWARETAGCGTTEVVELRNPHLQRDMLVWRR